MPKPTFLALPEAKRERFLQAALREFTEQGYDLASVSRLVAELGIAKGSVYQYFDDKLDLFLHLVDEAGRRKQEAVAPALAGDESTLARLRSMYVRGLAFWRSDPRWAAIGLRLLEPTSEPRLVAHRGALRARGHAFLRELLAEGRARGEIRTDLDLDTLAHLVHATLSHGLLDAFLARQGLPPGALPEHPLEVADDVLIAVVDDALALLAGGLAPPLG